jgi:signal transduction histidine kinase
MKSKDTEARHHLPQTASESWRSALLTSADIEKLVDRLSSTLQAQSQTVRELEAAHAELDARQRQLEEARAKAERASETLATFLKALGHDLRAPLVSVDAALQMLDLELRDGDLTAAGERVGEIRRTAGHGLALIDDLFELIRSDAGQWRVEPQAVRISEIVADARAVVAPKAHLKRLTVETRWVGASTDPRHFVQTDLVRIRQALVNLLVNAIKFSDRGPVVIEVERTREDMLAFRVIDNGPGVDPEALEAIFEPFTQGKRTVRQAKDGAGLGLAIVRRCARLLGGDVGVANRTGGGAIFTLEICAPQVEAPAGESLDSGRAVVDQVVDRVVERVAERVAERLDVRMELPVLPGHRAKRAAKPAQEPAPAPAPREPNPADSFGALYRGPSDAPRASNYGTAPAHDDSAARLSAMPSTPARAMHVLVVDGSADAAKQLTQHLRKLGLETAVAKTLAEARQLISQCRPDLIVSDRKLPDGSGLEFHDIAPGTRLVLSSANPDPNEFPPGTRILAKPYAARAVQEIVRVSLNRMVSFPT